MAIFGTLDKPVSFLKVRYNAPCSKPDIEHSIVRYSTFPNAHMYRILVLAVLEEVSPLPSLAFPCSSHCHWCLCERYFSPTGGLLPCIKLCGAESSPEKTEAVTTSGDQNQACAQETHCFHELVPVPYPAPVQDTQGRAREETPPCHAAFHRIKTG